MRRTSLLVGALAVVLSLAVPSAATPPVSYREVFVQSDPVALLLEPTCDGFDVLWTATADHRWTDFYDRDGELTLTTLHFLFNGTLYNSTDLSKTLAYQGGGFWEFDAQPVSDLSTYHFTVTLANGRVPLVAGVQKFVYISDDFDFIDWFAGIWFDDNMAVICEALG